MKKQAFQFSIAAGLFIGLWAGSYAVFRQTNKRTLWHHLIINGVPAARQIDIPGWMEPVKGIYRPLMALDRQIHGKPIHIGGSRLPIGATAVF